MVRAACLSLLISGVQGCIVDVIDEIVIIIIYFTLAFGPLLPL
jgi:hypothetical protein